MKGKVRILKPEIKSIPKVLLKAKEEAKKSSLVNMINAWDQGHWANRK